MHCQRSPACLVFIRDEVCGTDTSTTTNPAHFNDVKHNATAVHNPIMTSTKRASVMRCEITNGQHVGNCTAMDFVLSNDDYSTE